MSTSSSSQWYALLFTRFTLSCCIILSNIFPKFGSFSKEMRAESSLNVGRNDEKGSYTVDAGAGGIIVVCDLRTQACWASMSSNPLRCFSRSLIWVFISMFCVSSTSDSVTKLAVFSRFFKRHFVAAILFRSRLRFRRSSSSAVNWNPKSSYIANVIVRI